MSLQANSVVQTVADSDFDLVDRAKRGNRAAFAALVVRHYDFIFATAWKWARSREDAEDIAQDVCARLAKALNQWRGEGALRTWLYRIIVNAVRDQMRSKARHQSKLDAAAADPTLPRSQPPDVEGYGVNDDTLRLWDAVRELPAKQRDAVMLVYGEGLSQSDAASVLECSVGTIGSNIHDAKRRLKLALVTGEGSGFTRPSPDDPDRATPHRTLENKTMERSE
ncbi:MAG: RNA polymerase sigma factor [Pseudomonadota bacterium]